VKHSTDNLVLAANAPVDLQTHTTNSDGQWQPETLIRHFASEGFGLAAVTDHDRVDTVEALQQLAHQHQMPILVAAEFSTTWRGQVVDILSFGFDPQHAGLVKLTRDLLARQKDNTREVYENLVRQRFIITPETDTLHAILAYPSARQPFEIIALLKRSSLDSDESVLWKMAINAGLKFVTNEIATVVETAQQAGGVCVLAHPGRQMFSMRFDVEAVAYLREEVPIDGLEAYYPQHTPEQTAQFVDYATRHNLLISAGSDSHKPSDPPIRYPAAQCRALLERLGVRII